MINKLLFSVFLFISIDSCANPCDIRMPDLVAPMQTANMAEVLVVPELMDPDSGEPMRRYIQTFTDGAILLVEQKHCAMYNLTLTLLLPDAVPITTAPQRLGATLSKLPVWVNWFGSLDPTEILTNEFASERFESHYQNSQSFSYALDDKMYAANEGSEVLLSHTRLDTGPLPFNTVISIYLGVGGL